MSLNKGVTFLILAHSDPELFKRLVVRLKSVGNIVAHIDIKANELDYHLPEVHYVSERVDVRWAGYSMVLATLALMKKALSLFPDSSHFVLLSGACYPIVGNAELSAYFQRNVGRNLIRLYDIRSSKTHFWRHITEYHLRDYIGGRGSSVLARGSRVVLERGLRLFKRRWPELIVPYAGSQWWALTAEGCAAIVELADCNPLFSAKVWRCVFAPDEIYFHTALACTVGVSGTLGYSDSPYQQDTAPMHLIDQSLAKIYTINDLSEVRVARSDGKIFVRKLSSLHSGLLLDALDRNSW